jgi:hypothetical protein
MSVPIMICFVASGSFWRACPPAKRAPTAGRCGPAHANACQGADRLIQLEMGGEASLYPYQLQLGEEGRFLASDLPPGLAGYSVGTGTADK